MEKYHGEESQVVELEEENCKSDIENNDSEDDSDEQAWYWDYDENTWKLWDDDWDDEDYEYLDSE